MRRTLRGLLVVAVLAVGVVGASRLPGSDPPRGAAGPSVRAAAPAVKATLHPAEAHAVPRLEANVAGTQADRTTAARTGPASDPACATVAVADEIVVDIQLQRLWACQGKQALFTTKVTTGAITLGEATPDGTWQVYAKQTDRWLSGPGYSDKVNFWMPFYGGYGLHDAPWQDFPFGSPLYRSLGSHGCVQVPTDVMARLYAWASVGTTVHVED